MKYSFPLQKVLDLRTKKEEDLNKEKELVEKSLSQLRALLQEELQCYFEERQRFNDALSSGQILQLSLLEKGLEFRKQRLVEILSRVRQVESDVAMLNVDLREAKRDVKTVEKLKDKKEQEFWSEIETKERRMFDEMAVMRFARRERGEL
jgi:flagellar protein FliJ